MLILCTENLHKFEYGKLEFYVWTLRSILHDIDTRQLDTKTVC